MAPAFPLRNMNAFPLRNMNTSEFKQLCRALWGCSMCPDRENVSLSLFGQRHSQQCRLCRTPEFGFSSECPQQCERLDLFFIFYRQTTSHYVPDFFDPRDQALRSHQDLFDIISLLRKHGDHLTREECRLMYFSTRCHEDSKSDNTIPIADQERAFNLATTVMTMVKMSSLDDFSSPNFDFDTSDAEQGMMTPLRFPLIWRPEQTLQEAVMDTFPRRIHPNLQPGDPRARAILHELTAVNLTRIAKLRIVGTSDLRNHLRLDTVNGTVQIFHHTSFLKAHLLSSKREISQRHATNATNESSSSQSQADTYYPGPNCANLNTTASKTDEGGDRKTDENPKGGFYFPRQLALETLSTLTILFPPPSHPQFYQNQSVLRSLVSKSYFDPDVLRFGTITYQLPSEQSALSSSSHPPTGTHPSRGTPDESPRTIPTPTESPRGGPRRHDRGDDSEGIYPIFGHRLMTLYTELEDPTPRGILDVWLEKRSKSRHVMLVTLAGVTVAIILGVLSLAVSVFQAWISWQAWKYPA